MRSTHTYATLAISPEAHHEIAAKLKAAGYDHALHAPDDGEPHPVHNPVTIDMHGIGLIVDPEPASVPLFDRGGAYVGRMFVEACAAVVDHKVLGVEVVLNRRGADGRAAVGEARLLAPKED